MRSPKQGMSCSKGIWTCCPSHMLSKHWPNAMDVDHFVHPRTADAQCL